MRHRTSLAPVQKQQRQRLLFFLFTCLFVFLLLTLTPPVGIMVDASISWMAISHAGSQLLPSSAAAQQHLHYSVPTYITRRKPHPAAYTAVMKPAALCRKLPGLTRKQVKWCRDNLHIMESVRQGAVEAYAECQYQFAKRRWNCTMIDPYSKRVFGDVVLKDGTREAAFVHAMSAAGVAYRITKDCSRGINKHCGCDLSGGSSSAMREVAFPSPVSSYSFKGCSDNVHFGIAASSQFVDAAEKGKNQTVDERSRSLMNQHNHRAGHEALTRSMRRECKCHGVSGACEMKTCWDALPALREISNIIKDKFDSATEVAVVEEPHHSALKQYGGASDDEVLDNGGGSSSNNNNSGHVNSIAAAAPTTTTTNHVVVDVRQLKLERKNPMFKRHTNADLVYLDSSPDYCEPDPSRGVLGTKGRQCNASSLAIDGCDLLCCHRGHDRRVEVVKERCHCKFHYCCRVECKICERLHETYTCK